MQDPGCWCAEQTLLQLRKQEARPGCYGTGKSWRSDFSCSSRVVSVHVFRVRPRVIALLTEC